MPLPSMAFVADFRGSWPTSLTRSFPSHLGLSRDTDFFLSASAINHDTSQFNYHFLLSRFLTFFK